MEQERTLTLKSLKKEYDRKFKELEKQIAALKTECEIIKKVLTK